MGTIIGMIVIYFLFGKRLGALAKTKGYESLGFIILMYFLYFGIMLLSAYALSLILNVENEDIGTSVGFASIVLGIASAYFVPYLIIRKLPSRNKDIKIDSSEKIHLKYVTNKGELSVETKNKFPQFGDKVILNGGFPPDGKYKIGFMYYLDVKNGCVDNTSIL